MHGRLLLAAAVLALAAPASAQAQLPVGGTGKATATAEMERCAALGPKRPGDAATRAMASHLEQRFRDAGLETSIDRFRVPTFQVRGTTIAVVGEGARTVPGEAFAFSGVGTAEADVVDVGVGRDQDYAGKDAKGKIVLVERNEAFHRTSQLAEVIEHGGVAMLYVSGSPENLVQTGTVRFAQDFPSPIPTVTVGNVDGAPLRQRARDGRLRMRIAVDAAIEERTGQNVLGVRRGTVHPDRIIVAAGHYDSWHGGAVDNCSSMGSLLQVIDQTRDLAPAYTILFAAWDAEEIGLVGSYDWVMRHQDLVPKVVLDENFEMTSAATYVGDRRLDLSAVNVTFGTSAPTLNALVYEAATRNGHVPAASTANGVRAISGGIIPTDLQPFYAQGVQGFSTFSSTPFYHTTAGAPDKIDASSHVRVTTFLRDFLVDAQRVTPDAFALREVPKLEVMAPAAATSGAALPIEVRVTDPTGAPVDDVPVEVLADQRDFTAVAKGLAEPIGPGRYRWTLPAGATQPGQTRLTATVSTQAYSAQGFGTVEHRGTPVAERLSRRCASRRAFTVRVLGLRRAERVLSLRVRRSAGRVRVARSRRSMRVDLRGVAPRTVRVTATARTSAGRTLRIVRRYRTCTPRRRAG